MNEIRLYFEGDSGLRSGFGEFFKDLRENKNRVPFRLIAGGSNEQTRRDFEIANRSHPEAWNVLLLDAEGPIPQRGDEHRFWMVQIMESWFIADRQALVGFYKDCFYEGALPGSAENVEVIPKADVLKGLDSATRDSKKGKYSRNKRQHAQELLARINPARVQHSSAECARLFHCLREAINART